MSKKERIDRIMAYATVAMTVATFALALLTYLTLRESREASFRQIGVETWLEFEKRFDAPDMIKARKELAKQLLATPPVKYEDVSEKVYDFFEDLGVAYRNGYLDKHLAHSSFSLYVTRYWTASKPWITEERRHYEGDSTISEDFEFVAKALLEPDDKITEKGLKEFLKDESNLSEY